MARGACRRVIASAFPARAVDTPENNSMVSMAPISRRHALLASAAVVVLVFGMGRPPVRGGEKPSTPSEPQANKLDKPLTPHVAVTRVGRILTLDYQLLDGSGHNCLRQVLQQLGHTPPRLTVSQAGREIVSGTFEYG